MAIFSLYVYTWRWLPLLLLALLTSSSNGLGSPWKATFPRTQAERMIKQLNLFPPKRALRQGAGPVLWPRLVERTVRMDQVGEIAEGDAGASVQDLGHHAGYYTLSHAKDARMFYFFFESRSVRRRRSDPVVIWLTGGPGCSSELALFYENGPFHIAPHNFSLSWNHYGWDKVSNLIYVDQPTGTGFSYTTDDGDIRHDELGVSNDLYDFLQEFFKAHPEYVSNDVYITGESYAGHYIPAFASRVHHGNKAQQGIHINLKGFAIGNGLTNPVIQYSAYADYAVDNGLITDSDRRSIMAQMLPSCQQAIQLCGASNESDPCLSAYAVCTSIFNKIMSIAGQDLNYYDIRKKCYTDLCYDFSQMEKLLNRKSVRESLGVGNIAFVSCSSAVYSAMQSDWMKNLETGIPELLDDGIKLLVYAGEYDLICNWLGNWRWVHEMEWSGKEAFGSSSNVTFEVDGAEAGLLKSHASLAFIRVRDAGHMVPMDRPKESLEMLTRWIQGKLV